MAVSTQGKGMQDKGAALTANFLNEIGHGSALIVLEVLGWHHLLALPPLLLLRLEGQVQVGEQVGVLPWVCQGLCSLGIDLG